jgi:hypothetical protein
MSARLGLRATAQFAPETNWRDLARRRFGEIFPRFKPWPTLAQIAGQVLPGF